MRLVSRLTLLSLAAERLLNKRCTMCAVFVSRSTLLSIAIVSFVFRLTLLSTAGLSFVFCWPLLGIAILSFVFRLPLLSLAAERLLNKHCTMCAVFVSRSTLLSVAIVWLFGWSW